METGQKLIMPGRTRLGGRTRTFHTPRRIDNLAGQDHSQPGGKKAMGFSTLCVIAGVVVTLAIVGVVVWRIALLIPGGRVAEVEAGVQPPHAFELRHVSTAARAYRLASRIRMHGYATGSGVMGGCAGVVCRFRVTVSGRQLIDETVGFGSVPGSKIDRLIATSYMSHATKSGSDYTSEATYVLASIPACPAGTEIVAKGTFEPELGTETSMLDVFLGR